MAGYLRRRGVPTEPEEHLRSNIGQYDKRENAEKSNIKSLSFREIFLVALCMVGLMCIAIYPHYCLPKSKSLKNASEHEFIAEQARKYLEEITNIGYRTVGSYRNDVLTVNYLIKEIYAIIAHAHVHYHFDVEIQTASAGYALHFLLKDFTVVYNNISNVIVHMYPKNIKDLSSNVLLNAHFDTQPKTVGASDDAVSCAIMLETMRAISRSPPRTIKQGIVFLFNGAEEGLLDGSHAFVTQHRLAKTIKAFINLEAAGSGGKEVVFQTGPGHPWLIYVYASAAKYPYASVLAQEIFQSGVIPSDTDFRIFRDFGNLVGIDVAYASNGYLYHTHYDTAERIPDGSIQRGGENILSVIKALSKSPYLSHEEEFKQGDMVYFDLLGLTMVLYPKQIAVIVDVGFMVLVIGYVIFQILKTDSVGSQKETSKPNLISVIIMTSATIISWVAAMLFSVMEAYIISKLGRSLSWYSKPWFALALYGLPVLAIIMLVQLFATHLAKKLRHKQGLPDLDGFAYERSCVLAHFVIVSALMAFMCYKGLLSTYLVTGYLAFPLLFHGLIFRIFLLPPRDEQFTLKLLAIHISAIAVPFVISVYHLFILFDVFVPIMGRQGSEIPPEMVFAVLSALCVIVFSLFLISVVHLMDCSFPFIRFVVLASIVAFLLAATGIMFPYSTENPIAQKRVFLQHVVRNFHNADGRIIKNDSGIWLVPLDYLGLKPISHLPALKEAAEVECDGPYCGFPYFFPLRKLLKKTWYLKGPPPFVSKKNPASFKMTKQESIHENTVRYHFQVNGPDHMTLYITPNNGSKLVAWSFTEQSPVGSADYDGRTTYFTYFAHGFYADAWKFWLDFDTSKPKVDGETADIALAAHFVHGPLSMTKYMQHLIAEFPSWVVDTAWVSSYDVWKI